MLSLRQRLPDRAGFVCLRTSRFGGRGALGGLALELLQTCRQLVRCAGELELALVELARPRSQLGVVAARLAELRLALRELLLARLELCPRLRGLLLDRCNLTFALRQLLQQGARVVTLFARLLERLGVLLRLLLELLDARRQLARLGRELEFPLVELAGARRDALLALAGFRGDLGLALLDDLHTRFELNARLSRLLLGLDELLLALGELLLQPTRFVFRSARLLFALLERLDQLLVPSLRLGACRPDASLGMRELLLTLSQVFDLFLPLLRLGRALVICLLQFLDLQVDHLLALGDACLQSREPLLFLQRAVELREPLRDLALPVLELGLGRRERRRAAVERGRRPGDILLQPNLASGDLDLLVDCRTQKLHPRDPDGIIAEIE